jgi:pectin methylesterase-like acyl-CoA thioesterase
VNKNPRAPAVAAMISGDKSAFYRCGFYGLQDTLWDVQGRHYYNKCTVQGAIDFIFGAGQTMFEVSFLYFFCVFIYLHAIIMNDHIFVINFLAGEFFFF